MDDRDRLRQGQVLAGAEPGSPAAAIPIVEPAGRDLGVDGFLWFFGRKDSLIKVAGHRVSSEEIEVAATQSSHAFQAVAHGVPDPVFGQVVHLAVEPPSGTFFDPEPFPAHCREVLPIHMVPRHLTVWDGPMPRTGTGKIDRDAVIRGPSACARGPGQPCSQDKSMNLDLSTIAGSISRRFSPAPEELTASPPLFSSGLLDSFHLIELISQVEEMEGMCISPGEINLERILRFVEGKRRP